MPLRRVLVLPLTVVLGSTVALPVLSPASAQAGAAASATVVLRTSGSAEPLAQAGALSRTARLARQSASTPSPALQAAAVADAHVLGLSVDDVTPWSLVVHGSVAGIHRLAALPEVASVIVAGGPAPAGAEVVPLTGAQLRSGYSTSSAAPPSTGVKPIIATIQFAPWDSAELAGYVTNANLIKPSADNPHPVTLPTPASGEYTAISVGGAATKPASGGGSGEVALDQESLYATDPYALQRAYFADGSAAGLVAALNRVAADAQTMPGLVALSISWTWCESSFTDGPDAHQAMANVVAAGVTVFAASGDDGKYCGGGSEPDVAYPASDPLAIAVGGTDLDLAGPAETGWETPDTTRASGVFGSGGGSSLAFTSPSWQDAANGDNSQRQVPDISADAAIESGFYSWHDTGDGTGVGFQPSGGTSLSTAASTGLYVAELGSRGATNGGLGDLHSVLYSAPSGTFRDITSSPSINGQFRAAPGYDLVTGLGAPMWSKVVDRLLTQPVISVPATLASRVVPVAVSAPAGQAFLAWTTGAGSPPASCGTSAGQPKTPKSVVVTADGSFRIWAEGYVGDRHCFIVSTTTVVNTGAPTPPPPTTAPPTTAPPTTAPPTTAPPTTAPPTGSPVTSTPAPVVTTSAPAIAPVPPVLAPIDVTPPTVTVIARRTSPASAEVSYSWRATDGSGSGVSSVTATFYRDGRPVHSQAVKVAATLIVRGVPGHAYRVGITATDVAGNTAGFASNLVELPYDDRSFALSKAAWSRSASHVAFDGSFVKSTRKGATATIKAVGKAFSLLTATGPADGIVAVFVDGKHVRDLNLYSKAAHADVVTVLARFRTARSHRITLLVKGTHVAHAKGTTVAVDGLLAV